jgi:hypothetical protein
VELALALENPAPDLTGAEGVNLTPDAVARIRWEPGAARTGLFTETTHVQGAVLVRMLRGAIDGESDNRVSTVGFGGTFSGVVIPLWDVDDRIKFALYGGWGIGRYITDLGAEGGQDAVFDVVTNNLRALPVAAAYAAYEHRWAPKFLSAVTYGIVSVSNLDIQPTMALRRTQRATANVTWNPITRADLVVEFLAGERVNNDGESGQSTQVQAGWRVRF